MSETNTAHPLIRLYRHARQHRPELFRATLYSILNKVFDLAPPILIGAAVDVVVQQQDSIIARFGITAVSSQLYLLAVLTLVLWGLESFFQYLYQVKWRNLAQTVQHDLRTDTYAHEQDLEMSYFADRSTGGLMSVLNDDVNQLERFLDVGANDIIQLITTITVVGGLFVVAVPSVSWLAILPIPIIAWGSIRFQRMIAPKYAKVREQVGVLNGHLSNNLAGIATIKSFTAEEYENRRITEASDLYRERNRDAIVLSSAFVPLIRMVIVAGFIAILVFGGQLAINGALNVGVYSVLIFMTQRLLWPLTRLGQTLDLYQRAMASTERILNLLDTEVEMEDGQQRLPAKDVDGEVVFDDVGFEYEVNADLNGRGRVIKDLSIQIPAGSTVAIVGATGSGKSTLVKLLLRFYDVQSGRITLDGVDVRDLRMADLRSAIGLVSQDVYLFHGTVRENIAYGTFEAGDEDIVAAATIAEAHEFIQELSDGYDTVVGERGQKLSGGQRQRISIARAVLKNPPVLVLDEATSAVDNETEAAIQRSLERIVVDRTTIVIAHRLSTIRNADTIFVLDSGRLVEHGSHEELLATDGVYAGLWRVQAGERSPRDRVAA